jgi:hypothetical protein
MDEGDDTRDSAKRMQRHAISTQRVCDLGIISFRRLLWTDVRARVVNLSMTGIGIESDARLEPGFVWFKDRVGGHRGGVLMWSREQDGRYRAGIRFVPLSRDEEQYVQKQVAWSRPHAPVHDPEMIINTIIHSLKKEGLPDD